MLQLARQINRARWRIPNAPMQGNLLLALVAGLTLVMPVSYRAGTEQAHPHATFQLWIDASTGQSHHHEEDEYSANPPNRYMLTDTEHVSVNVASTADSRATLHDLMDRSRDLNGMVILDGDEPVTVQPDAAQTLTNSLPVQFSNVLGVLGLLVALMAVQGSRESCWAEPGRLTGIVSATEPPPPRSCLNLTKCSRLEQGAHPHAIYRLSIVAAAAVAFVARRYRIACPAGISHTNLRLRA